MSALHAISLPRRKDHRFIRKCWLLPICRSVSHTALRTVFFFVHVREKKNDFLSSIRLNRLRADSSVEIYTYIFEKKNWTRKKELRTRILAHHKLRVEFPFNCCCVKTSENTLNDGPSNTTISVVYTKVNWVCVRAVVAWVRLKNK